MLAHLRHPKPCTQISCRLEDEIGEATSCKASTHVCIACATKRRLPPPLPHAHTDADRDTQTDRPGISVKGMEGKGRAQEDKRHVSRIIHQERDTQGRVGKRGRERMVWVRLVACGVVLC